jgi:hypothetical protein
VDAYVKDLSIRVTAERRRAEQAERAGVQMRAELVALRNQPPPSFEHLGAEAARVLEGAGMSAKLLIEEARTRGEALVEEAEAQAKDLIERAELRASELEAEAGETVAQAAGERDRILAEAAASVGEARTRAEEDVRASLEHARESAERTLQKAVQDQATMEAETGRLRESRDRMLEYLGRIHSDLGELLAEAVQADAELSARTDGEAAPEREPSDGAVARNGEAAGAVEAEPEPEEGERAGAPRRSG